MRHVAIGDPQAPFETFLAVLAHHRLLASPHRLADDVHLVSMGDQFDWGGPADRARAAADGLRLVEWLASHGPEQVTLLAGNHDLSRVCDLGEVDAARFAAAQCQADTIYRGGVTDQEREAAFLRDFPFTPTAELVARDYGTFTAAQRDLVAALLRAGRLRLAHEHAGILLVHAGVTVDDLQLLGLESAGAAEVARGLNRLLDERVARWAPGRALDLRPLHQPGSPALGEARGIVCHRPSDPQGPDAASPGRFDGPPRRRFDPRRLPAQFPQAIGHIRDKKCRELMPRWHDGAPPRDGPLRSLLVDGDSVRYVRGASPGARLYFLDGGMSHAAPAEYQLFDLDRRAPLIA
jgi:hypothetical protein